MPTTELIETFWETIPPIWRQTRGQIRGVAAERFGLTVEQFQALRRIRKGYDSVSTLAEEGRLSRSQASRVVEVLVNKKLVTRLTDSEDRRHIHLSLTKAGETILSAIYAETEEWLANRFQFLTNEETEKVVQALSLLREAFKPVEG